MKHNTKSPSGAPVSLSRRMIAVRLTEEDLARVEQLAKAEQRPTAQFARICLFLGIKEFQARKAAEG